MQVVMPGLVPDKPGHDGEDVPVIDVLTLLREKDVDARDKTGQARA
jgi:hypothetical protein